MAVKDTELEKPEEAILGPHQGQSTFDRLSEHLTTKVKSKKGAGTNEDGLDPRFTIFQKKVAADDPFEDLWQPLTRGGGGGGGAGRVHDGPANDLDDGPSKRPRKGDKKSDKKCDKLEQRLEKEVCSFTFQI